MFRAPNGLSYGRYLTEEPTQMDEQKHEEHVKKDHAKLENAVHQHHPDRASTLEEALALKKHEEEADAASAKAAE